MKHITWWKTLYTALKRNGWRQLFFYLSNLDVSRFIEFSKVSEFLEDKQGYTLELGCGYSVLPAMLSNEYKNYICLDLSKGACKYQYSLPNVSVIVADMQHLPFKNNSISTILAISSIEHVPDDKMVFEEIKRISKQDVSIIIDIPHTINKTRIDKMERPQVLMSILYNFKTLWKVILGRHLEYFIEQTSTDSVIKYYNMKEINKLIHDNRLCIRQHYIYEKYFQQKFFNMIPRGWFILKDLIFGNLLFRAEELLLHNNKTGNGIILLIALEKIKRSE